MDLMWSLYIDPDITYLYTVRQGHYLKSCKDKSQIIAHKISLNIRVFLAS